MKKSKSSKASSSGGQMKMDSFLKPKPLVPTVDTEDCQVVFVSPKKTVPTGVKRFRESPLKVGFNGQIDKRPKVIRLQSTPKKSCDGQGSVVELTLDGEEDIPTVDVDITCQPELAPEDGDSFSNSALEASVAELNDSFSTLDIGELDRLVEEELDEVEDSNDICISQLPCKRLVIDSIDKSSHKTILMTKDCSGDQTGQTHLFKVVLKGFWTNLRLTEGVVINVFGKFNARNVCTVTDRQNFVIAYPDVLVTGTAVSSGVFCARKTVLSDRIRGGEAGGNLALLLGSLVHQLFQECCTRRISDTRWMQTRAAAMLNEFSIKDQMYASNIAEEVLIESIFQYIPYVSNWIKVHMNQRLPIKPKGNVNESYSVVGVHDIEENIWSPRYGIRGKIDLTLKVKPSYNGDVSGQEILMPLELKTGKASFGADHRAQVMLYTLMISHIHKAPPPGGLLLYLKDGSLDLVKNSHQNIRGVLQLRNELAYYLSSIITTVDGSYQPFRLPTPIENDRICRSCPQLLTCAMFYRNFGCDEVVAESTYAKELVPQVTAHLSPSHLDFFAKWVRWICIEWEATQKRRSPISDVWLKPAVEREYEGSAVSELVVAHVESGSATFRKLKQGLKIPMSHFSVGDIMVISNETENHIALAMGQLVAITESEMTISLDSPIVHHKKDVFRLDKYESMTIMSICLSNVVRLMEDVPVASNLRRIIVDVEDTTTPIDEEHSPFVALGEKEQQILEKLNEPQREAVLQAANLSHNFLCVEGFPGTGKTGTIVALVKLLTALGKSVLLTSYTHSAVDNILLKLKRMQGDIVILRVGSSGQIHPECRCFSIASIYSGCESNVDLKCLYNSANVVAGTALGLAGSTAVVGRLFDVCIVDEASMLTLPTTIAPLLYAKAFVLVGDQRQLSPLVMSKLPKSEGMDDSLFSRLTASPSGNSLFLHLQYRMNSEIMRLSNALWYDGLLACGTEQIANATCCNGGVTTDCAAELGLGVAASRAILSESLTDSIVFLDTTDLIDYLAVNNGQGLWCNIGEAKTVANICRLLLAMGVDAEDIGVIGFYRHQCTTVRKCLRDVLATPLSSLIEVNTADQYQGRDKRVIIITFVWTDQTEESVKRHELLKDPRRLNVALTRAKQKLILIGNSSAIRQFPPVASMLDLIRPSQRTLIEG